MQVFTKFLWVCWLGIVIGFPAFAATDPLPSWNKGPAKQAIVHFVKETTDIASAHYVVPAKRVATFDQDGTLWVEQPMYTQVAFAFDRVLQMAPKHPEWKKMAPFKAIIQGDKEAIGHLTDKDLAKIMLATHSGISVDDFTRIAKAWMAEAKHPRWHRPYSDLVYRPMIEVMQYLKANGFRTYIVTGAGQGFVRSYAEEVYGVPPQHVIGSALKTKFEDAYPAPSRLKLLPEIFFVNNYAGKAEDIYLLLGERPQAAFGNSTGDQQMLAYTEGTEGPSLKMMVLHDDAEREYAYGPATGLPETKIGVFTQALYDEAKKRGWIVVSMKNDWCRMFAFERCVKP